MDPNENRIRNQGHEHQQRVAEDDDDYFDLLPDAILHLVFNKLIDARTLIRCLAVSKRFASLVSQSDTVFLAIPRPLLDPKRKSRINRRSPPSSRIRFLVRKLVFTPMRFICRAIARTPSPSAGFGDWYYWPSVALKEFRGIKSVHMELPCCGDEIGSTHGSGGPLLKWKAEFGAELKSCVVLGASSLRRKSIAQSNSDAKETDEERVESESEMGDEELKLRIVWTVSSLIAASMRHYLVKQTVAGFPKLQSVVITDSSKQGKLCMEEKELKELKDSMKSSSTTIRERTAIPDLNMKMRHMPVLDLPASGFVMTAATLVVIRPSAATGTMSSLDGLDTMWDDFDAEEGEQFGGAYGEAVRKLIKLKRYYDFGVNSF